MLLYFKARVLQLFTHVCIIFKLYLSTIQRDMIWLRQHLFHLRKCWLNCSLFILILFVTWAYLASGSRLTESLLFPPLVVTINSLLLPPLVVTMNSLLLPPLVVTINSLLLPPLVVTLYCVLRHIYLESYIRIDNSCSIIINIISRELSECRNMFNTN
jgi:hypothetical protein